MMIPGRKAWLLLTSWSMLQPLANALWAPFLDMDLDGFKRSFRKLRDCVNSVRLGVPLMAGDGALLP